MANGEEKKEEKKSVKQTYIEICIAYARAQADATRKPDWQSWEQFLEDQNVIRGNE